MSDVVATILLLALTVVLFASIFAFVTSFPAPPAQNANQFQAQIISAANGTATMALAISILHLAGPAVSPSALIYLKSSVHPTGPEFAAPYTLAAGGLPAGQVWNLGQTWYLSSNFTGTCSPICHPILPDNITIYIVSGSSLLFSAVIPGAIVSTPPTFLSVGTSPAIPAVGEAFTITASIQGVVSTNTVLVTLSGLPGLSYLTVPQPLNYSATTGLWTTFVPAGRTTASGSYYAFVAASNSQGKTGSAAIPVAITPYSTLIANAFTVGSAAYGLCSKTTTHSPAAACQGSATQEYYFTVTITASAVTFGSVLFEVVTTATGAAYATAGHAVFAIAANSALTTPDLSWAGAATGPLLVTSTWTATWAAGFSSTSPLTTSYTISVDVGTTLPSATAGTLSFIVIGTGAYSSQTALLPLPAS